MKARVERERGGDVRRGRGRGARRGDRVDVKLGPGGMADVEWTVQLRQLLGGGSDPRLRRPGALAGIDACRETGALSAEDADALRQGWLAGQALRGAAFLAGARRSELVPTDPDELGRLARRLGYPPPGGQALREDLTRAMRRVRNVHERVFYGDPQMESGVR